MAVTISTGRLFGTLDHHSNSSKVVADRVATVSRSIPGEGNMLPMHPHDDYPYHQAITPMGSPVTSDPRFNDGYYFAFYREDRHVFCGLRFHPNNNVVDGYAGAVAGGVQRGFRASRALDADRSTIGVGPLRVEIIEPMVSQRVVCEANDHDIAFDIVMTASCPAFFETPHVQYRYGRVLNHVLRYTQPARATGVVTIDGVDEQVDGWFAARDHSWGIRQMMGPPLPIRGSTPLEPDPRALRLWVPFAVGAHAGFFHLHEDVDGEVLDCEGRLEPADGSAGESQAIVAVRHDLSYLPDSRRLSAGVLELVLESDEPLRLEFGVACAPAHPQGFGYGRGWSDGGNPGVWRGVAYQEGERFDVSDPGEVAGPPHSDPSRRLGGTEFVSTLVGPGGAFGMAHVEHMLYR
jgi:hypothetical protein